MAAYDVPTHRRRVCERCGAVVYERATFQEHTGKWLFVDSGYTSVVVAAPDLLHPERYEKVLCKECALWFLHRVRELLRPITREEAKNPDET